MSQRDRFRKRREMFCQEYLKDLNGKQAAIRAGYSERTAAAQASELLQRPDVQARVAELIANRSRATGIDAAWVLRELQLLWEADFAELYTPQGTLRPIHEIPPALRKLISGVDSRELAVGTEVLGTITKVKIFDRMKVLENIGRHIDVGAFRDKVEHSTDENLADLILAARKRSGKA